MVVSRRQGFDGPHAKGGPPVVRFSSMFTEGKRHDIRVARQLRFEAGTIVVIDRRYNDYEWFGRLTADGVFFVTRLKDHAV